MNAYEKLLSAAAVLAKHKGIQFVEAYQQLFSRYASNAKRKETFLQSSRMNWRRDCEIISL